MIEGKVGRRFLDGRTTVQQSLGKRPAGQDVQRHVLRKVRSWWRNRSKADYGSGTLYILMEVARSIGTALRAVPQPQIVVYQGRVSDNVALTFAPAPTSQRSTAGFAGRTAACEWGRAWLDRYANSGVRSNGVARGSSRFLTVHKPAVCWRCVLE